MKELARRRLGRTGLLVSEIGLGGVGVGGAYGGNVDDANCVETVERALTAGINYIDTSPLYAESERRLGIALSGVPRDTYYLSTKTGTHRDHWQDYSRDGTLWTVENSLKLLKVDYVDVLLVHDPERMEPVLAEGGALDTLEDLKRQGVLRWIGLGQRNHDFHKQAIRSGRFDVILTYNDYHITRTTAYTNGLLQTAEEFDVGVLNGSPMGHGLLAGDDPRTLNTHHRTERDTQAAARLYDWCKAKKVNQRAVVLQSCLKQSLLHCTLTGAKNPDELQQNLDALTETLPDWVWEDVRAMKLTEGQV
jgi:aryl-alcohol dehydrogenase-like predicted oxidoreductase